MSLEKFLDQAEDGVDPRVQIELERLNTATDEINKLEVDLDEARNQFRQLLQESTSRIDSCAKKLGSCINKVKPYYDARIKAKEALHETQKAAVNFERANSAHSAAKEMVYLAEEGLKAEGRTFDHAWQEMLNHATMRVNESESERTSSEAEHKRTSQNYQLAEIRVRTLQKELKRAIAKSRPYYELKIHYTQLLEKQKVKVKNLEKQVTEVKLTYAQTLKNLEQISDEIHKTRQKDKHPNKPDLGKRSEGVGAESDSSNEVPPLYNTSKSRPECAKSIKSLHSTEGQPRAPDLGDDSETGKRHRNRDAHKILSPVAEAPSSEQTLTPLTTISSPLDTDIWSEYSDAGNVEASPNSENDSSLTGPPDTESEDEIFKFPQALTCIGRVKEDISFSNLKGAGDAKSQNIPLDAIGLSSSKSSFSSTGTRANTYSQSNSVFEGVGICSFPVETELNLSFTEGSKNGPTDTENGSGWTEIKLSSPEEEPFSLVRVVNTGKNRNQLEDDFDIPYAPLSERDLNVNHSDESPGEKKTELIVDECSEKNGLDGMLCGLAGRSPRKENLDEELCPRSLKGTPKKLNLRRQSLDVLWNNTAGEKVKEILSQSIMKLNIGSLTERKAMDSRMGEGSEECENENTVNSIKNNDTNYESNLTSQFGIHFFNRKNSKAEEELIQTVGRVEEKKSGNPQESISTHIGGFMSRKERFFTKKVPSPLEKTLNYLNADEESNSDSESLASSDMLTDEQLSSLVLDRDLAEIYQDIV